MVLEVTAPADRRARPATGVGVLDTLRCAGGVLAPMLAQGWANLRPRREHLRARFQRRVDAYVRAAEPVSLAGVMAGEAWLAGAPQRGWTVYPFSAGPGVCPTRNLVLLATTTLPAALLQRFPDLPAPRPLPEPLPRTLDHTGLQPALQH
ncbi:hypothetical protein [Dactylosporangium sp. CA-139066]|uniref:hypothetical protein n=1 Tax=Dactylosporangium sp. CA-139066 TaxID=3239930 RepID=UPI003D94CE00